VKEQTLTGQPTESERLRQFYQREGGWMSFRELAEKAAAAGVFDESTIERAQVAGLLKRCKDAFRPSSPGELPFGAATEDGRSPRIKQLELFTLADYEFAIRLRVAKGSQCFAEAQLFRESALDKFHSCGATVPTLLEDQ
jgi:hypothetical protein